MSKARKKKGPTFEGPLISSQRGIKGDLVKKARKNRDFRVYVFQARLLGNPYTVVIEGHHRYHAARQAGHSPVLLPVRSPMRETLENMSIEQLEFLLINSLTEDDWFDMETGQIIPALLRPSRWRRI